MTNTQRCPFPADLCTCGRCARLTPDRPRPKLLLTDRDLQRILYMTDLRAVDRELWERIRDARAAKASDDGQR